MTYLPPGVEKVSASQPTSLEDDERKKNTAFAVIILLGLLAVVVVCWNSLPIGDWLTGGINPTELAEDIRQPAATTGSSDAAPSNPTPPTRPAPTRMAIDLSCPEPEHKIGDTFYHLGFRVYEGAGSDIVAENGTTCDTMAGCELIVLDGPMCINGFNWYLVRDEHDRMQGWWPDWDEGGGWNCIDAPARDSLAQTYGDFSVLMYGPFVKFAPGFVEAGCNETGGCEIILGQSFCHYRTLWTEVSLVDEHSSGWLPAGAYYLLEE